MGNTFKRTVEDLITSLRYAKRDFAPALTEILDHAHTSGNLALVENIVRTARILDITTPDSSAAVFNPEYNLVNFLKANVTSRLLKSIDANETLFKSSKPFTCVGAIIAIFQDTAEQIRQVPITEDITSETTNRVAGKLEELSRNVPLTTLLDSKVQDEQKSRLSLTAA